MILFIYLNKNDGEKEAVFSDSTMKTSNAGWGEERMRVPASPRALRVLAEGRVCSPPEPQSQPPACRRRQRSQACFARGRRGPLWPRGRNQREVTGSRRVAHPRGLRGGAGRGAETRGATLAANATEDARDGRMSPERSDAGSSGECSDPLKGGGPWRLVEGSSPPPGVT